MNKLGEPGQQAGAWQAWRAAQPEADERDIPARDAFRAGYAAAAAGKPPGPAWHTSLATVLIVAIITAAICYMLTSP